ANPISIVIDPSGQFAYSVDQRTNSGEIRPFTINPTSGVLTVRSTNIVSTGATPVSMVISPSGRLAYVANQGSNSIIAYKMSTAGVLSVLSGFTSTTLNPNALTMDPSGQFFYTVDSDSQATNNKISAFTIGADNLLTPIAGSPFEEGTDTHPLAIATIGSIQ
ncbi:MAG TPA: beta-propeller fold lactonase family protein, partial [Nitrospiria bacterium]|nr:beta-propeller fold lactonase family protein [Nitrospiria bacterium]